MTIPSMESEDLNTRALAPNALLWHYTNFRGLEGILGGTIWASSLTYLNDTEEFHHGAAIALEVLQNELALALGATHADYADTIHSTAVSFLREKYRPRDIFVTALSTEADDLSQWRAYGGASGPMFSVGFDPRRLEEQAARWLFELQEVKYKKRDIVPDVRLALKLPIDEILETLHQSKGSPQLVSQWAASLAVELLMLAPLCKDEKFAAEKEWRLVRRQAVLTRRPALELKFRHTGSLVVPYLAMPLHEPAKQNDVMDNGVTIESPVAAITIGPSPHPDELLYSVREMTARIGLTGLRIEASSVPYRNW